MKSFSAKLLVVTLVILLLASLFGPSESYASKKKKKLTDDEMTQISNTVNSLVKKVYSDSLFSPKDNDNLIDMKIKLDDAMAGNPNPDFAQLYFKLGYVYKEREMKDDAVDCYQTILENFADSPYAVKATNELKKMGVQIANPSAGQ
jgi:hypothetical protein